MGSLENINEVAALHLGGWLAVLSLHPRMSLTSLIWEWAVVLCREPSESSHMCFHSARGWNWLHLNGDAAAPVCVLKQAFNRESSGSGIQACNLGPSQGGSGWAREEVVLWRQLTSVSVLNRHQTALEKNTLTFETQSPYSLRPK